MPKMTIRGLDELGAKLSTLSQIKANQIMEDAVKDGADIVADKVRSNLNSVLSGTSSGDLAGSLGITPVDNRDGYINAKVGFDGRDANGTPNALKAGVLEYGSKHQPARPFIKPAATATRAKVKAKMSETVEREIESFMNGG